MVVPVVVLVPVPAAAAASSLVVADVAAVVEAFVVGTDVADVVVVQQPQRQPVVVDVEWPVSVVHSMADSVHTVVDSDLITESQEVDYSWQLVSVVVVSFVAVDSSIEVPFAVPFVVRRVLVVVLRLVVLVVPLVPLLQVVVSFVVVVGYRELVSDDHSNSTAPVLWRRNLLVLSSVQTLPPSFDAFQNAFDVDVVALLLQVDSAEASVVAVLVVDALDVAVVSESVVLVEYTGMVVPVL